jgi:hypothetical protein
MATRIRTEAEPHADGNWYCTCPDADDPHVHCPWGGMHTHLVDIETGRSLT